MPTPINQSRLGTLYPLEVYKDARGHLIELWRNDTQKNRVWSSPMMTYISNTLPGVVRGPHEHKYQTDYFCFYQGKLELHLWNSDASVHEVHMVGEDNPVVVKVPPGVVHAYKNVGDTAVDIVNMPDRLYAGVDKKEQVDEIRHELDTNSIYKLDHCPTRVVIVTGAAGFIGFNFCRLAQEAGYKVVAWDKKSSGQQVNDLRLNHFYLQKDIVDAQEGFREIARYITTTYKDPEVYLVNFAAETHNDRSFMNPEHFTRSNVEGPVQLFRHFWREIPQARRMVHVSTDEVYGPIPNGDSKEGDPLRPTSPYASSKMCAEIMLKAVYESTPGPKSLCITRGGNTYGPYQHPEKFLPMMLTRVLSRKPYPVYQPTTAQRSWQHVDDHCKGVLMVLEQGEEGQVYNVGRVGTMSNSTMMDMIARFFVSRRLEGMNFSDIMGLGKDVGNPRGTHHDLRYSMDMDKIAALGFKSEVDINTGVSKTLDWYMQNESWWKTITDSEEFKTYMATMYPTLEEQSKSEETKAGEKTG